MSGTPNGQSELSTGSFGKQIASFGYIFWVANWIELIERFAYYGVRAGLPMFMVLAIGEGGPELTQIQKGTILAVWAVVQCFVPVLSGGFADRFGYKLCIVVYTMITSVGFLIMGFSIRISEFICGMPLSEARLQSADWTYTCLFTGAMFVATGTGIFKPGVQGLIANRIPKSAASLGWGIFYQMVNVGGFLGPLVTGRLRIISWELMFVFCACAALLNLIPLFFFREPSHPQRESTSNPSVLLLNAFRGLLEPRLFFFTITFAGFWMMFMQLFDQLTVFLTDWIDSRSVAGMLVGVFGVFGEAGRKFVAVQDNGNLAPEWIVNLNALLICTLAFAVGYFTGKMRSLTAIIVGIALSATAICGLGLSASLWWILAVIAIFSFGEMMASPTKMRYLASIAPPGKEGQFMGYANFTVGIGWATGSILVGYLYEYFGDKVVLARDYLVNTVHLAGNRVKDIPKADLMPFFEKTLHLDQWEARRLLWETYRPYWFWFLLGGIGIVSMLAIAAYTYVCRRADANPNHTFNIHGAFWVRLCLVPICLLFGGSTAGICYFSKGHKVDIGLLMMTLFFLTMLAISLFDAGKKGDAQNDGAQT